MGVVDDDGYIQITDRAKDVIKSGGEWISSVELENALIDHPEVLEAAVIGVPDEKWGERPLAAVVLRRDPGPVTPDELRGHERPDTAMSEFLVPERSACWSKMLTWSAGASRRPRCANSTRRARAT